MVSVLTVFISGCFGLLVAIVTWTLANRREKRKFMLELNMRDYKDKEALYISMLSSVDKVIRIAKSGDLEVNLIDDLSINTAKAHLLGSRDINLQMKVVSDNIYHWSLLQRKATPRKIGGTGVAMFSSENQKYQEEADAMYEKLRPEIQTLVKEIKIELESLKKELVHGY